MNDQTFNLTCTSKSGRIMTLVFTCYNDLSNARREARKLCYRDFGVSIGHTVECAIKDTVQTLKLYNK